MIAYVQDARLAKEAHSTGRHYWDVYIAEMAAQLGLEAAPLALADIENAHSLDHVDALILGKSAGTELSDEARRTVNAWVRDGGLLIGFAIPGLDEVFGIQTLSDHKRDLEDTVIDGYFNLLHHPLTHEVHPLLHDEEKLPVLSEMALVTEQGSTRLARLFTHDHAYFTAHPAITWHTYGQGAAGYFAFDLAKTVWLLHQGRPLSLERVGRTNHMSVLAGNSYKVPYADEMLHLLQNMLAQRIQPFIHQIPPDGDTVPQALLFWGGDCCAGDSEDFRRVSDWMKAQGLPYHFNLYSREGAPFNLTDDDARVLRENGHEISLHFSFSTNENLSPEGAARQVRLFESMYGFTPVCTVVHGLSWKGWVEPAKWLADLGIKADNTFAPVAPKYLQVGQSNGPSYGFGFGTSFPFFLYDDSRHGNARLDFVELPIVCYEIGHRGSIPPYSDKSTRAAEEVRIPIDLAVKYRRVMNMFYHPVYIADYPPCRAAIEEALRYVKHRGYRVLHMGADAAALWWRSRDRCRAVTTARDQNTIECRCTCEYEDGMVVKFPVHDGEPRQVTDAATSRALPSETCEEFGTRWLYVVLPRGETTVRIHFNGDAQARPADD